MSLSNSSHSILSRAFPGGCSGEMIFVAFQLLPLPSIRGSWWLSDITPWFSGAMLFQVDALSSLRATPDISFFFCFFGRELDRSLVKSSFVLAHDYTKVISWRAYCKQRLTKSPTHPSLIYHPPYDTQRLFFCQPVTGVASGPCSLMRSKDSHIRASTGAITNPALFSILQPLNTHKHTHHYSPKPPQRSTPPQTLFFLFFFFPPDSLVLLLPAVG